MTSYSKRNTSVLTVGTATTAVIGYVRVSTEEQRDGNSFECQAAAIEDWAKSRGLSVPVIYFDCQSGAKLHERLGLLQAIDRAKEDGAISGIVVFNYDRFFRDLGWSEVVRKELAAHGKSILSVQQEIDLTDKYGQFNFQVQQAVAELRRREIVDLLLARRKAKGDAGGWTGGKVPYGFRAEQGELVPLPSDLRNMRLIRRLRKWVGMTQQAIADYMNSKMAIDASYGPKHTQKALRQRKRPYKRLPRGCWSYSSVGRVLHNFALARIEARRKGA